MHQNINTGFQFSTFVANKYGQPDFNSKGKGILMQSSIKDQHLSQPVTSVTNHGNTLFLNIFYTWLLYTISFSEYIFTKSVFYTTN